MALGTAHRGLGQHAESLDACMRAHELTSSNPNIKAEAKSMTQNNLANALCRRLEELLSP